jgi:hypothetical protein
MDSVGYPTQLRRDLAAFEDYLDADLSVRIQHCGDWTLHDLAEHLGRSGRFLASQTPHPAPPRGQTHVFGADKPAPRPEIVAEAVVHRLNIRPGQSGSFMPSCVDSKPSDS